MGRVMIHQKDTTQDALVKWLEARGCVYEHIGKPLDGLLAVPLTKGIAFYITVPVEFKSRYGVLRPSQLDFLAKWPAKAYVLKSEVECAAMLAELGAVRL